MKATLHTTPQPSRAEVLSAFVKLIGLFAATVLPLAGLNLVNWLMKFIF